MHSRNNAWLGVELNGLKSGQVKHGIGCVHHIGQHIAECVATMRCRKGSRICDKMSIALPARFPGLLHPASNGGSHGKSAAAYF